MQDRGSREQIQDVESELQEAMSETYDTEQPCGLLDGKYISMSHTFMLQA